MQRLLQSEPSAPIVHGTRGYENAMVFVSVIWAIAGPRFAAVASTEEDCLAQIAQYVAEQAQRQLWPPAVGRVAALLATGDQAGAITEYFRHVGERWDPEWIATARLALDPVSGAWVWPPSLVHPLAGHPAVGVAGHGGPLFRTSTGASGGKREEAAGPVPSLVIACVSTH
jgi:hypothetical protein